jgi:hypothetical protein
MAQTQRVQAQTVWRMEFGLTLPLNVPLPLSIAQEGHPDLEFTARYASRPFESPLTWQLRLGRWSNARSWELELLHHKIHLENGPPEVQSFSVSHGYNLLTVQRGWKRALFEWRLGGGMVIAHVENTVRGMSLTETGGTFGGGYYATGPALTAAMARPVPLGHRVLLNLEGRLAASRTSVPVVAGKARGFNVFLQLAVLLVVET